jgi:NAD(P)H-hydrate epimerase
MITMWPSLKPVDNSIEAKAAENYTIHELGVPPSLLMENAGRAVTNRVTEILQQFLGTKAHVAIFCGPGNNGADALVCARQLLGHHFDISIFFTAERNRFGESLTRELELLEKICARLTKPTLRFMRDLKQLENLENKALVIVDGIFGAGLSRAPQGLSLAAIEYINFLRQTLGTHNCRVVSIDVPSGLSLEASLPLGAHVRADYSITFGHLKRCHVSEPTKKLVGKVEVCDIGLYYSKPASNFYTDSQEPLNFLLKPLGKSSNKGDFGHVAILEGHVNFIGASRLAARAALRVGAGLVTLLTSKTPSLHPSDLAEFMKKHEKFTTPDFFKKISGLVIGPGLGQKPHDLARARSLLKSSVSYVKNIILDADALALIHDAKLDLKSNTLICTPHPQEAAKLLGVSTQLIERDRFLAIENLAKLAFNPTGITIWVLKGATTLIRQEPYGTIALSGDAPILATGGSGDMLAGAIGGLLAQSRSPLAAVVLATSLQICAARRFSESTKGIFPSELADRFPSLLQRSL